MQDYIAFLKYCLDESLPLPENTKNIDWKGMQTWAEQQAIVGIIFSGIEKAEGLISISREELFQWIGYVQRIEQQNRLVNKRCVELVKEFQNAGFDCSILKGQGNAMLYQAPLRRSPGDIDLLVIDKRNTVTQYVKDRYPHTRTAYQHIDYPVFNDVPVEIHYLPIYVNNPFYNLRLQRWFKNKGDKGCMVVNFPGDAGSISVPSNKFNVIYQLTHLMHHFFDEGIGLRQMIDYYYVLKKFRDESLEFRDSAKSIELEETLKYLGLWKFAGAVMYVMREVFGLEENYMIAPVDEKRGKTLMNEILKGGNFGKYSGLTQHSTGGKYFLKHWRNLHFVREYPSEALCEPFFRTWHFFWRLVHK